MNRVFDPPFAYLGPSLLALSAGNPVDSQLLRLLLQNSAEAARASLTRQSARLAARNLADQMQQRTQQANKGRLLASTTVLMDETELWRVDPTGQFYQCQVVVAGRAADKVHQEILRELTKDMAIKNQRVKRQTLLTAVSKLSLEESLSLAVRTIHSVFPQDSTNSIYLVGVTTTSSTSEKPSTLKKYSEEELLELLASDSVA
jgi:20S proteasome alpha/beta subunit